MNARMRAVRPDSGLYVIVGCAAGVRVQLGRWARFQQVMERAKLLLGSPVASFRWACTKRRAVARKNPPTTSDWQGRRSHSFAESERDGIVMGF
jgi:hypothetical protein